VETLEKKTEFLNKLGTKKLIGDIQATEDKLTEALNLESKYRNDNVGYLAPYGEDCTEVKQLLATLILNPPLSPEGKKPTVAELGAWLTRQRVENVGLAQTIARQNEVTFSVEAKRIYIDVAKKHLESLKAVLALRTAQIEFLK